MIKLLGMMMMDEQTGTSWVVSGWGQTIRCKMNENKNVNGLTHGQGLGQREREIDRKR